VNALTCSAENATRQPHQSRYSPRLEDPLRGAMIATASQKLHLRRLRSVLTGPLKTATVTRLLDVNDSVFRALQWLQGRPGSADAALEKLKQLATEPEAIADPVGVVLGEDLVHEAPQHITSGLDCVSIGGAR
jgi:hypothetical protein